MPRLILTDRDRETLHRLAAEWRSEPAPEDRGARTRETLIGLIGGGEHFDRHAAYLLALSLVELLSSAHLPSRAGSVVLRALESLADGEGGGEYVKIMNDLRGLPGAPTLPDSPCLSLLPDVGSPGAGGVRAEPWPGGAGESGSRDPALWPGGAGDDESHDPAPGPGDAGDGGSRDPALHPAAATGRIPREATAGGEPSPTRRTARPSDADPVADPAGGDASAAWDAPPPEAPEPEAAERAMPNLPGVDIEALARRAMQFAGNGIRDGSRSRTPRGEGALTAQGRSGGSARDGLHSTSGPAGGGAQSRTPFVGKAHGDDARDRAPATPGLEPVLLLESAGERFALRAGDVIEILGAHAHDAARTGGRPPVFVHRGESYPIVDPVRALALEDTGGAGRSGPARAIVLLRGGGRRVALLCGGVGEREELPVHALPPMVPREALATSAVIPGGGRPVLLLDTAALAEHGSS